MKLPVSIALWLVAVPFAVTAQAPAYVHESWTVRDGLPVNIISSLLQSRDGYMWIGTLDGLVRFDGVRFTTFNAATDRGLPSSRITALKETSDSSIWIETEQNHLVRFHHGQFILVGQQRSRGFLAKAAEDHRGALWVGIAEGLAVVRENRLVRVAEHTIRDSVSDIAPRRDGSLLVATHRDLFRMDGDSASPVATWDRFGQDSILTLLEDRAGTIWVATTGALWRWRGDSITKVFSATSWDAEVIEGSRPGEVWYGNIDRVSRIESVTLRVTDFWKGNREYAAGLTFPDRSGRMHWTAQRSVYTEDLGAGRRIVELPTVSAAVFDREGSLWVGTQQHGLHRLKPAAVRMVSNAPGADNNTYAVLQTRDGAVWFGAGGSMVRVAEDGSRRVFPWRFPSGVTWARSLLGDRSGRLWIGGYGLLTCTQPVLRCGPPPGKPPMSPSAAVLAIHEFPDGTLWFGTDRGLVQLKGGDWLRLREAPEVPVRAFLVARDSALWMATAGAGILRWKAGAFRAITEREGLPSNIVRSLHQDRDGWLWAGTEGRGLARLDPQDWAVGRSGGRINAIGTKDGLYDDAVHQILEDADGRIWLNGNRGVSWLPQKDLVAFADGKLARLDATSYTERDGMFNREGNGGSHPAGIRTRDGKIWFPTQNGVAVFDPANIRRNLTPPPVVVEQVKAGDTTAWAGGGAIALGKHRRDLEISYSAMSFLAPANVRFRYRLDPYDRDWIEAGARRTAFYTRVPAGRYTFRVIASNNDGVWNTTGASVQLDLAPRLWETTGCRLVLVVLLLGLTAAGVQWRLRRLRARGEALEALVTERTSALRDRETQLEARNAQLAEHNESRSRLFANLSHEFRTPLTLILGPIRSLLDGRHGKLSPGQSEQAELMQRNSQRLLRLINQVLDLARLQGGAVALDRKPHDLVEWSRGTTLAFAPLAERRRIALDFAANGGEVIPADFDAEQLEKVLLNLLSNAFKFTDPGGSVRVWVGREGPDALLVVQDTGVGIAPEQVPRVFDRFYQADASTTRRYEGTGIGLALARELVELHGGRIEVESELGSGSTFTVRIPAGTGAQAHGRTGARIAAAAPVDPDDHDISTGGVITPTLTATIDSEGADRTTVLLIDDNADVRAFVRSLLSDTYRVLEAGDGKSGLALAREALPDLIVADVMMPELDGLSLGRELKTDPMTDAIPVVLLSARAASEDQVAGLETGADAYLLKPFDPPVLLATVTGLLAQRRRLRERFRLGMETESALTPAGAAEPEPSAIELRLRPLVQARLTDTALDPEALAAAAGLSYHQLYRALRDGPGVSPSRFIRTVRVEAAADRLRRGAGGVSEVAYSVGFESLSYFSRAFSERFGAPPSSFLNVTRSARGDNA